MVSLDHPFLQDLGLTCPIFQAPMAGVATPALAAAVSQAGGLGALSMGASSATAAATMIAATAAATARPFNVNLFCHTPARRDPAQESAWCQRLAPLFAAHRAEAPAELTEIYQSFVTDDAMLALLLATRPAVVSFHFGLPPAERLAALRAAGCRLIASVTSLAEGQAAAAAGLEAVIAQGYEAGGHRGLFDPDSADGQLGTLALTRLLVAKLPLPVIAAGGIMDGAGIAAVLTLGAMAAQLGTAFIACPESQADPAYRAALLADDARLTEMTRVISGRPARSLVNSFTRWGRDVPVAAIPAYPLPYDAGKALNGAARQQGDNRYGAQWAGQGAALARALPAAELMATLKAELSRALESISP